MLLVAIALQVCVEAATTQYPQYLRPPTILSNFTFYMRRPWTNLHGTAFAVGAPIRLSDFAGTVVFLKFFDPT